ncbi:uncharacterized protein RHO25_006709 [Cercospora beticola]|uniref:2EXR domain-containing protein n=2 Tax=Cercospora beticola TaxID=122368 RepID=A0ABZ0NR99_CERBT|nr:hypothetical protein RHO25_006709 [Cercospora beticola]
MVHTKVKCEWQSPETRSAELQPTSELEARLALDSTSTSTNASIANTTLRNMADMTRIVPITHNMLVASSNGASVELPRAPTSKTELGAKPQTAHVLPTPSRLLQLPAELRNRIYRLVLHTAGEEDRIIVTEFGHERPALLQTCKKIRNEALKIYYYENSFRIDMNSYDSALLARFTRKLRDLGLETHSAKPAKEYVECYLRYGDREPNWANLLQWMKFVHSGLVPPRKLTPAERWASGRHSTVRIVISSMNNMVRCLADRPWEEVKKLLEDQRVVLATTNARWMDD